LKTFRKVLIIVVSIIGILLLTAFIYINVSLPKLPALTNKIIEKALASEQNRISGKQGYALNGDTKIWYNSIEPNDSIKGNIILIMGIANDALAWPDYFYRAIS